jgi:hypothetical protein
MSFGKVSVLELPLVYDILITFYDIAGRSTTVPMRVVDSCAYLEHYWGTAEAAILGKLIGSLLYTFSDAFL